MRCNWEALRKSMVQIVNTLTAHRRFISLQQEEQLLKRFEDPVAMVAYLTERKGDLDEKDRIYAALVRTVQNSSDKKEMATALLWLGLWSGLDRIYCRRLRHFMSKPDDLVCEISYLFTSMIHRIDLSGVNRLAATLVRNVNRDIGRCLHRQRRHHHQQINLWEDKEADESNPLDQAQFCSLCEQIYRESRGQEQMIYDVVLHGWDLKEIADQLRISHEAVRKRYQRLLKKLGETIKI